MTQSFISRCKGLFSKPHLRVIALVGLVVPRRLRSDWRQEWETELRSREELLAEWDRLGFRGKLDLVRRSTSAFWDALWLQPKRWEDEMIQDLRFGARMLFKHKAFTMIATLSLALGVGANTAIFSLINTTLLKTLPVKDPRQLALFTIAGPEGTGYHFNYPLIEEFVRRNHSFTGVFATSRPGRWRLMDPEAGGELETIHATRVTGNFFSVLGVSAAAGRTLSEEDDQASGPQPVAVISYNLWKRRFGLKPGVVGRKIMLDNYPFTIIGVAPAGFFGIEVGDNTDLWFPLRMTPLLPSGNQILTLRGAWVLRVMARLKPGISIEQASAEMDVVLKQHLNEIAPDRAAGFTPIQRRNYFDRRLRLEPGATGFSPLRATVTSPLLVMMIIVGLVLLIACANVANLLLARAASRRREMAVRLALGAGRFRLIRQLLTESVLLALLGGVVGLLFARWGSTLLLAYLPSRDSVVLDFAFDSQVLGFTLLTSLLAVLLFGVAPALRATRLDLGATLKDAVSESGGMSRLTAHKALAVAQVALAICLLIGAGLFVRSLQNLKNLNVGFDRENVTLFELDSMARFTPAQRVVLQKQLFDQLERLPGAVQASKAQSSPLIGSANTTRIAVEGYTQRTDEEMICRPLWVGPNFFKTMGIPLFQGRDFSPQELQPLTGNQPAGGLSGQGAAPSGSLAAVINQTMARHFFGEQNPLGRRFRFPDGPLQGIPIDVIGVAKDAVFASLREQTPRTFYLSFFQWPTDGGGTYLLRALGDPSSVASAIQRVVRELDPQIQVLNLKTMDDVVDDSLLQERFVAHIGGFFSLSALLLACIGLYGVMSYAISRRTHEIGVRMALGAQTSEVMKLALKQGMRLVLFGVLIGLAASLAATQAMKSMLFGLTAVDPATYALVTMLLLIVALLACYLPARRATKVDPIIALRRD